MIQYYREMFSMWRLLVLLTLVSPATSNPRNTVAGKFCSPEKHAAAAAAKQAFDQAMDVMIKQVAHRPQWGGYNTSAAGPRPKVRASWQCHDDLSLGDCATCMSTARSVLGQCLPSVSGAIYLDGCMIRYYSGDGGDKRIIDDDGTVVCGTALGRPISEDPYMMGEFDKKVNSAVWDVATNPSSTGTGHSAVLCWGGVQDVYALGQCWSTSSRNECLLCLINAAELLSGECGNNTKATEGRAMFEGCYMRYSVEKFFDSYNANDGDDWSGGKIIIAGVLSSTILALIAIFIVYFCYRRISKKKRDLHDETTNYDMYNSSLNFKYEILESATNHFDQSRKLGQGGSGSVFKGILPDERIVAVKRLFFSTRQWVDEFFNEVNLIHDIEHKNLVKLLGCSIEGPESLLVYEYVPNRSLDQIIFDKKNTTTLVWEQRFDIITGTAEGLAYLHEGCGLRIIHRDVKASNVLLDDDFMPKIADFGLARSVTNDRTHISTGIAGTLGYMAPEYLVRGQLTEKADVYAFGVLILEIVCGRRNSPFTVGSNSLLHNVWKLYKEDKILESVDPTLRGIFNERQASNALQIGLLCTQASVSIRPTMFAVIEMLSGRISQVPAPNQPPFLNSSMLTAENETRTHSSSQIQSEISCSFTANSSTIYDSICQASVA